MMDEKKYTEEGKIVNHNTNCQVFNGPISGSIFAMPGSHVDNHPVQTVGADGSAKVEDEGPKADDDRLLIPIPGDLPVVIMNAPELTIKQATNTFVIRTIQDAGMTCKEPWHYACLMAVCDDHGILVDRTNVTNFARTMAAWGIYKITCEDEVKKLANSMLYTLNKLPLRYKEWDNTLLAYKNKCESLATYFGNSMPYRHGVKRP